MKSEGIATLILWLIAAALSDTITCPSFNWDSSTITSLTQWYQHDNLQPVQNIYTSYWLDTTKMCNMDLASGEWAWLEEANQNRTTGSSGESIVQTKKVNAYWKDLTYFSKELNNGREWLNGYEWKSTVCSSGTCQGQDAGTVWKEHANCDNDLYCKTSTSWPYLSTCSELVTLNEVCDDDYSWISSLFWWYASANDKASDTLRCIERYAKPDNYQFGWSTSLDSDLTDEEYNGIHCTSGLAYQNSSDTDMAVWVTATAITQDGTALSTPYEWDPTDNSIPCHIEYGSGASDYIEVECKWAMYGQTGYCSKIPGTTEYKVMTNLRRRGYVDSVCHTLDRDDYLALMDSWGNMKDHSTWYTMYYENFKHEYWPYMQVSSVSTCFEKLITYSPIYYVNSAMSRVCALLGSILVVLFLSLY